MWYQFPTPILLSVTGKDAQRYLNSRLSNDCRGLVAGNSLRAAALTAQGRVEALFTVFCKDVGDYLLLCAGGDAAAVEAAFRRYIVADRVSVSNISHECAVFHVAAAISAEEVKKLIPVETRAIAADARIAPHGHTIIVAAASAQSIQGVLNRSFGAVFSTTEFAYAQAQFGTPSFPEEVNQNVMLTECQIPDSVSFTKGCYVGQEVIERSDAIGKVPRLLFRIVTTKTAILEVGAGVSEATGSEIGRVVSWYTLPEADDVIAFALLRNGKCKEGDVVNLGNASGTVLSVRKE